ncbi:MAG: hypothetical protein GY822_10795 [Deltaproteobacteria bacterium]|nr:hypothetical protein [Deltaproteobacteria bacterium]
MSLTMFAAFEEFVCEKRSPRLALVQGARRGVLTWGVLVANLVCFSAWGKTSEEVLEDPLASRSTITAVDDDKVAVDDDKAVAKKRSISGEKQKRAAVGEPSFENNFEFPFSAALDASPVDGAMRRDALPFVPPLVAAGVAAGFGTVLVSAGVGAAALAPEGAAKNAFVVPSLVGGSVQLAAAVGLFGIAGGLYFLDVEEQELGSQWRALHLNSSSAGAEQLVSPTNETDAASTNEADAASTNETDAASTNETDAASTNEADAASTNEADAASTNEADAASTNETGAASE